MLRCKAARAGEHPMTDFVTLNCPDCDSRLEVPHDIDQFACAECGAELAVRRRGGIVALELIEESDPATRVTTDDAYNTASRRPTTKKRSNRALIVLLVVVGVGYTCCVAPLNGDGDEDSSALTSSDSTKTVTAVSVKADEGDSAATLIAIDAPTATHEPTSTHTATRTDTPTATVTHTSAFTPTPSHTPTITPTPSITLTPTQTPTASRTPTPTKTRTPRPTENQLTKDHFDGLWIVGVDIAPGRWKLIDPAQLHGNSDCYWARYNAVGTVLTDWYGNDAGFILTVASTDALVEFDQCRRWEYLGP